MNPMNTKPNDYAFPVPNPNEDVGRDMRGLTKREWLFGMILQGMISNPNFILESSGPEVLVDGAMEMTDLAIETLNKESEAQNG